MYRGTITGEESINEIPKNEENSQYEDFIERKIVVHKDDCKNDITDSLKYFTRQVIYPHKGVDNKLNI